MNQIIIIAHNSDFANYFRFRAQLLAELTLYGAEKILALLNAAARRFDKRCPPEIIVALRSYKIEQSAFVIDDCPGNISVMVDIIKGPLRIP